MLTHPNYKILNVLSNISLNNHTKGYNSYGDALYNVLKNKDLDQRWLAKKIQKPHQKIESLESQISRWVNKGTSVKESYRDLINKTLNVSINQENDGLWYIRTISSNKNEFGNQTITIPSTILNNSNNSNDKIDLNPSEKEELVKGLEKELNQLFKKFNRVRRSNIDYDTRNLAYEGALNMIEDTFRKFLKARHES